MDRPEVSRRLKAARALRGVKVTELAKHEALQRSRITANLIGETERQERDAREMELRVIAEALELPAGFLLDSDPFAATPPDYPAEFAVIAAENGEKINALAAELETLRATINESADKLLVVRGEFVGRIYERLSQIDEKLAQFTRRDTDVEDAVATLRAAAARIVAEPPAPPTENPRRRRSSPRGKTRPEADPGQDAGQR